MLDLKCEGVFEFGMIWDDHDVLVVGRFYLGDSMNSMSVYVKKIFHESMAREDLFDWYIATSVTFILE